MGKLFKLIETNVINLAFDDNDKSDYQFSDYVKVGLAESRIAKLYQLLEEKYKELNLKAKPPKFPYDSVRNYRNDLDRDKLEETLNNVEELLGDNVDDIVNEVNKIQNDNLVLSGDLHVEVVTKESVVDQFNGLLNTLEIAIKNNDPHVNNLVTRRDILKSFKSEVSKLIYLGLQRQVLEIGSEEYKKMNEFVEDPYHAFMKYNTEAFENDKEKDDFEKYAELDNKQALSLQNEAEFIDNLKLEDIDSSEELASKIREAIKNYLIERRNSSENNELPHLGQFMYDLKERITEVIPDSDIYLGNDKDSNFIKDYLHNPIEGMTKYIDEKIKNYDERDLLKNRWFEDEDTNIDFEKLINNQKRFKDIILREKATYDNYSKNKIDEWHIRQDTNSKRFENMFKDKMNNVVIPQAIQNNKGGFFENLFGTTSKEYKEFSKSLVKMIEEGSEKGDLDGLRDKTEAYLSHKFKDYDPLTNNIKEEDIAKLDSTSQGRVRLCLAVLDSIDYAKKAEYRDLNPYDDKMGIDIFSEITKLNNKFEDLDNFQKNLKNDSEIDKNNIIDNELNSNNNIIENDIKK